MLVLTRGIIDKCGRPGMELSIFGSFLECVLDSAVSRVRRTVIYENRSLIPHTANQCNNLLDKQD